MKRSIIFAGTFVAILAAAPLSAQAPEKSKKPKDPAPAKVQVRSWGRQLDQIPAGYRPPPGMCRIWIDGVPAGRQPAPTDCATAVRNRPSNGRVIHGDDYDHPGKSGEAKAKQTRRDSVDRETEEPRRTRKDSARKTPPERPRENAKRSPPRPDTSAKP